MTSISRGPHPKTSFTNSSTRTVEPCSKMLSSSQSKAKRWRTSRSTPSLLGNLMVATRTKLLSHRSLTRTSLTSIATLLTLSLTTTKVSGSWSQHRKVKANSSHWSLVVRKKKGLQVLNKMKIAIAWMILNSWLRKAKLCLSIKTARIRVIVGQEARLVETESNPPSESKEIHNFTTHSERNNQPTKTKELFTPIWEKRTLRALLLVLSRNWTAMEKESIWVLRWCRTLLPTFRITKANHWVWSTKRASCRSSNPATANHTNKWAVITNKWSMVSVPKILII